MGNYHENNNTKDEKGKMRKIRRGKKNQNIFKNSVTYYVNIRGIKSKIRSLNEILDEVKPHIICLNETFLGENVKVEIDNYELIYNNNKDGKGGVIIGIHNDIKHLYIVVDRSTKTFEALWVKISNNKDINIRIGVIYAPQESKTKQSEIEKMYYHINKHKLQKK